MKKSFRTILDFSSCVVKQGEVNEMRCQIIFDAAEVPLNEFLSASQDISYFAR